MYSSHEKLCRSHSASRPAIGPTSAPDTDSKSTPDNGSTSNTRNALWWVKRTKTSFAEWLNRRMRDMATTTTTRAHTTTTRAHTTTTRAHTTTTRAHTTTTRAHTKTTPIQATTTRAQTTITPTHTTTPRAHNTITPTRTTTTQATTTSKSDNWWAYARTPWYGDWRNRVRRRITTPHRRYTTTTPWSGHRNYDREKEADSSWIIILSWVFSVSILICVVCICCCQKKAPSYGADTTINQEIGPVQPPEASPHTEGTTAPYGSIDQAEESLPTYNQALSMPSSYGHTPVPLPVPSVGDGRSPPAYSEINMQLSPSAIRVSTVGWAARSPFVSVNNMTTMTRY